MGLRFILGRSGSGKTHRCLREIADLSRREPLGPPLLLIAPDQATYQLERDLLTVGDLPGYFRPRVVSFQRLAFDILYATGVTAPTTLGPLGRRVLIHRLVQIHIHEMACLARSARTRGFYEQFDRLLREILRYDISAANLAEAASAAHDDPAAPANLAEKLHDLSILVEAYQKSIGTAHWDPDYALTLAAQRLSETNKFRGARIWLDGFAEFTPQQFRLLRRFMATAESITVAFNLDPRNPAGDASSLDSLFSVTSKTHASFLELGATEGIARGEDVILDGNSRRFGKPVLEAVEKLVFLPPEVDGHYNGDLSGFRVIQAPDRRSEVAWIGREVLRLAREEGVRYREMALILRKLEPYEANIREVFGALDIPVFIDRRRDILHHPLIELVRAAVELAHGGWRRDPLFRYLRTGFLYEGPHTISSDDVDRLEMLVVSRGLDRERWSKDELWEEARSHHAGEDQGQSDESESTDPTAWRRTVEAPLQPLIDALRGGETTADELVSCLLKFLEELRTVETLQDWREDALERGELIEAQEHEQAHNGIFSVLDQLRVSGGSVLMPVRQLMELLDVGLQELTLGFIPPGLDQVLVGTIERSRQPALHTVFAAGFGEGAYPLSRDPGGLLPDEDRAFLEAAGIDLAPSSERASRGEPYIAYIALTRASQSVVVSYPQTEEDGGSINPSPYLADIRYRIGVEVENVPREHSMPPADLHSAVVYATMQIEADKAAEPRARELGKKLADVPEAQPLLGLADLASRSACSAGLDTDCRGLFHKPHVSFSVTRLERFAACPFQHFAHYGLRLEPADPYVLESKDIGILCHRVLQVLVEGWIRRGVSWREILHADALQELDQIFDETLDSSRPGLARENARDQAILRDIREHLHRLVVVMLRGARAGAFDPECAEYKLDEGKFRIRFDDATVRLIGSVDRVDACNAGNERFIRIIDYKTGIKSFDWPAWYAGLQLQLPAYLLALFHEEPASIPLAAFYLPIRPGRPEVDPESAGEPRQADRAWLKKYQHSGFYAHEGHALLHDRLHEGEASSFYKLKLNKAKKNQPPQVNKVPSDPTSGCNILRMLARTQFHLETLSRGILDGETAVSPYKQGQKVPCDMCDFGAVCRFDPRCDEYRDLPKRRTKEIKEALELNPLLPGPLKELVDELCVSEAAAEGPGGTSNG